MRIRLIALNRGKAYISQVFLTLALDYFLLSEQYISTIQRAAQRGYDRMKCPECGLNMDYRDTLKVRLNECTRCKGIWFDHGELDTIKDEIEPDLRWMDFDLWKKEGDFRLTVRPRKCPKCLRTDLRGLHYETADVTIHYCPACEGIWLQGGDFHKIVLALLKEADRKNLADYFKESLKEASEIISRPERFISEWRDLKAVMRLLKYRFFVENPKIKDILVGLQKTLPL